MIDDKISRVEEALRNRYSLVLRPANIPTISTCRFCHGPVGTDVLGMEYVLCPTCNKHSSKGISYIDTLGICTYAIDDRQMLKYMYDYKDPTRPNQDIIQGIVGSLLAVNLYRHITKFEMLNGPFSNWTIVPSSKNPLHSQSTTHPLFYFADYVLKHFPHIVHLPITVNPGSPSIRDFQADLFKIDTVWDNAPDHVLLIEDTWVSGSKAQSAAYQLKAHGASRVIALAVARKIKPNFLNSNDIISNFERPSNVFNPAISPWNI
ncbi:hypothetical protein [Arcanobacterium bovis]|uniref:Phosphoribosyltransferase n=1 Tax=Arcanobacterium bovis TaxID=2529275 RepID=A0A4Q9UYH7_9ACTO|nr:hypothetical protein [Arcanobacterium bovis]TBW20694.1 hypothetical protein EZJ44_08505 [Arcanobacterium bovis]